MLSCSVMWNCVGKVFGIYFVSWHIVEYLYFNMIFWSSVEETLRFCFIKNEYSLDFYKTKIKGVNRFLFIFKKFCKLLRGVVDGVLLFRGFLITRVLVRKWFCSIDINFIGLIYTLNDAMSVVILFDEEIYKRVSLVNLMRLIHKLVLKVLKLFE